MEILSHKHILKLKKRVKNGRVQWYVKFEGWPDKYNQWIDEINIKE